MQQDIMVLDILNDKTEVKIFEELKSYPFTDLIRYLEYSNRIYERIVVDKSFENFKPFLDYSKEEIIETLIKDGKSYLDNYILFFDDKKLIRINLIDIKEIEIPIHEFMVKMKSI